MRRLLLALIPWALAGCLTHMPPESSPHPAHMQIHWRAGFEQAKEEAKETRRPILLVTAAGDITGFC